MDYSNLGLLALRLAMGVVFIYHGLPKVRSAKKLAPMVGMSAGMVLFVGLVEILGGLGVITGLLFKLSALGLAIVMLGALYFKLVKWHVPFSAMDKMGWEFDIVLLAGALVLLLGGGGSLVLF
ncbi:MAG: DoxX family protein [Candidatus Campbellbacteria bacterium]|nr:DoxX family protein [Candidatus Campbellbacteria bacterium]